MIFTHRLRLLAFATFTWATGIIAADVTTVDLVAVASPAMTGIGAGLFVAALLPGRTARFS